MREIGNDWNTRSANSGKTENDAMHRRALSSFPRDYLFDIADALMKIALRLTWESFSRSFDTVLSAHLESLFSLNEIISDKQ